MSSKHWITLLVAFFVIVVLPLSIEWYSKRRAGATTPATWRTRLTALRTLVAKPFRGLFGVLGKFRRKAPVPVATPTPAPIATPATPAGTPAIVPGAASPPTGTTPPAAVAPATPSRKVRNIRVHWWLYAVLMAGYVAVNYYVAHYYAQPLWNETWFETGEVAWKTGQMVAVIQLLYFLGSFRYFKAEEIGGVTLFGLPVWTQTRGPILSFLGLLALERLSSSEIQFQLPAEPEHVYKHSDKEFDTIEDPEERARWVRPMRILTGGPSGTPTDNPLDVQMVIEPSVYVRFYVKEFFVFWIVTHGDIDEARRQLRDTIEVELAEILGQKTPRKINATLGDVSKELQRRVILKTLDWGIEIDDVRMLSPDTGHTLAARLRDIAAARATATKTRIDAAAEKDRLTMVGQGNASATQADLEAEAVGLKANLQAQATGLREIAAVTKLKGGEFAIATQAVQAVMGKTGTTIISDINGIGGMVANAAAAFQAASKSPPTDS